MEGRLKKIIIPEDWKRLLTQIKMCKTPSIILVMGAVDTGKSTLANFLFKELTKTSPVALVDADLGQSTVGPPTTVGLAKSKGTKSSLRALRLRFVGSTSPVGYLLQTLVTVKKLLDKAIEFGAARVVIDTSGLVSGALGREFKFQKIELVNPTHIVALQKVRELEPLLKNFSQRKGMKIYRLKVDEKIVRSRPVGQRRLYREKKFRSYFKNARLLTLHFASLGLHGRIPDLNRKQRWQNLLIGLCDSENDTLALGIIQDINLSKGVLSCITPLRKIDKVKTVQFGSIYLNENGCEL